VADVCRYWSWGLFASVEEVNHPPNRETPVALLDAVADARGWEPSVRIDSARAYAFAFTPTWEGFFSDVWRADDLRTLADKVDKIQQPGAAKLALVYRQVAGQLEEDPDSAINLVASFLTGTLRSAVELPKTVTRAVTPWGPIILGGAILLALAMRK